MINMRFAGIGVFNIVCILIVIFQIIHLGIKPDESVKTLASELYQYTDVVKANRGQIYDRRGKVVAGSIVKYDLWIDPANFNISGSELEMFVSVLNVNETELIQKFLNHGKRFVYVTRGLDSHQAQEILSLSNPTLHVKEVEQRYYPYGASTASLLGIVDSDGIGIDGLELMYNDVLSGEDGFLNVKKDRHGHIVERIKEIHAKPGKDIHLPIDGRLQFQAYQTLKKTVIESEAESASAVILDAKTGHVRAVVNYPSVDPNSKTIDTPSLLRNRAATDLFEPGSTIKPLAMSYLLDQGDWQTNEVVNIDKKEILLEGHTIKDVSKHQGKLTPYEVLQKSSNIGMAYMITKKPSLGFYDQLTHFGFCQKTLLDLPGEVSGICPEKSNSLFDLAALSFGYGFAVNTLQLAQAYLVFANDGLRQDISLNINDHKHLNERVFKKQTALEMRDILSSVVSKKGTGRRAAIQGIDVSGKTGTSNLVSSTGYDENRYVASFVGLVPTSNPIYVVAVVVREPNFSNRYGGKIAAPAFANIVSAALGYE